MALLQLDWRSASRYVVADPRWRAKLFTAGLVLLLPVIGWPTLLGYRKEAVFRLARGASPILPDWGEGLWHFTRQGFEAVGVIHVYLAPVYVWFLLRVVDDAFLASAPWGYALLFVCLVPLFLPLLLPAGLIYARFTRPEMAAELYAMGVAFHLAVFTIPAGFLNVTRTGRIVSAFDLVSALRLIVTQPRRYVEAWVGSGVLCVLGHFCVPFSPWGIAWCYLGITYLFNEVPRPGPPAFGEFRRYWQGFEAVPRGMLVRYEPLAPDRTAFTALRLGPVEVPVG